MGTAAGRKWMIEGAQGKEWRKLGVWKSSLIDTDMTGVQVRRYKETVAWAVLKAT